MRAEDLRRTVSNRLTMVTGNRPVAKYLPRFNRTQEPEREAVHSDLFRLAYRALMLIDRGASERNAVQLVAASNPRLVGIRRKALTLVLGIVNEQDLLDLQVQSALPDEKLGVSTRSLCRLIAYALLRLGGTLEVGRIERVLRDLAPIGFLPKLELLIGTLPAYAHSQVNLDLKDSEGVALETHHPVWWVNYCFRTFGRADAIALLSSKPRPRYLRINPLKNGARTTLPKKLKALADKLTEVPSTPGVYTVKGSPADFAEFFQEGLLQLQDLASYLTVKAGDPKPREKILDLCAAPGAKTAAIAQLMRNRGEIVSVDYSPRRMRSWKAEIRRLGVEIAEPVIGDAARLWVHESFDLVIVDPPCSGTGVFDRNPRMKWHLSPQSVDRYSILQRRFLESAAPLVEPDGRILYCTCSLTLEENENVVSAFLISHPEFEIRPVLGEYGSSGLRGMSDARRFYPNRDRTAGYFIARLDRTS